MRVSPTIAIMGGGPAGLMAAEVLSQQASAADIHVYDAMPSVGRKFLMAGRGGLNITHSEPLEPFLERYGDRRPQLEPMIRAFTPDDIRAWVHELGSETFVGSSGRIFPVEMKASPLLRAWLRRLQTAGVTIHTHHRWVGWDEDNRLLLETPDGRQAIQSAATILALGGGSWSRLGSDGAWVPWLTERGVEMALLRPSNCGFEVDWSDYMRGRFAGEPLKTVVLSFKEFEQQGEFVITQHGVEGSLIYAVSALVRDEIEARGSAVVYLDLAPNKTHQTLVKKLSRPRGSRSVSSHLNSRVNLKGVKMALLHEFVPAADFDDPERLATAIKALPLLLTAARPLDEAISSAGGVTFAAIDKNLMLRALPGVFCAGEMLDWEAPTGGYLLTACLASGRAAAQGVLKWLSVP